MGDYIAWADYLLFIVFQYRLPRRAYIYGPLINATRSPVPISHLSRWEIAANIFFAFIRQEQASKSTATSLHFFIPYACLRILRLFAACVAPKKQMLAF
jgi:hypothetical protein